MSNRPLKDGVGTQETINSTTGQIDLIFNAFTDKATPVDTDIFAVEETGGLFKKVTWANIKATAKTYFDTLYSSKLVAAFTSGTIDGVAIGGTTPAAIAGTTLNVGATSPTISVIRETVRATGSTDNVSLVTETGIRTAVGAGGGSSNTEQSIAYASTITPDLDDGNVIKVGDLTGNITVANPSNATTGEEVYIRFVQDTTGGRTITLGTDYVLLDSNTGYSTDANAVTFFSGITQSDGSIEGGFSPVDAATAGTPWEVTIALSDETTALTTGTAKVTWRQPCGVTLTAIRASVTTAPTGSVLTVDVNESGTTILSTKLTIDATEKTSTTAATPAVISDTGLADDAEMTADIDGIGSTIAGAGLKVTLIGTRT